MSGTFPTSPVPRSIDVISDQPVFVGRSNSRRRHARKVDGHLWFINVKFPPLRGALLMSLWSFQMKNDQSEVFQFQYPLDNQGVGLADETGVLVNQLAGVLAGATSVPLDGLTPNITNKFMAGDFITFGASAKMHQVVDNANTDATGATVVNIRPETIHDLSNNTPVVVNKPSFTVAFKNPQQEFKINPADIYRFEFQLEEAIL